MSSEKMKPTSTTTLGILPLVLCLAACSSPMVRTNYDHSVHFSEMRTYAWQPMSAQLVQKGKPDPDLDRRIRLAIEEAMQSKGLQAAEAKDANLLLDYTANASEKVDAVKLENYETAEFMGLTYTLGTLHLTMSHGSPTAVVWEGTVQANIDKSKPLAERDEKLREAVHSLLQKFPPQK